MILEVIRDTFHRAQTFLCDRVIHMLCTCYCPSCVVISYISLSCDVNDFILAVFCDRRGVVIESLFHIMHLLWS